MFLSMMSAFAQEESISISQNMRKGAIMRMKTVPSACRKSHMDIDMMNMEF